MSGHFYPDRGVAFVSMSRPSRPRLRNHAALEACYACVHEARASSRKPVIGRLERGARASTPSTSVPSSASSRLRLRRAPRTWRSSRRALARVSGRRPFWSTVRVCERAKARGAWKARLVLHFLFVLCLQLVAERGLFRSCFALISRVEHVFVLILIAFSLEHLLFTLKGFGFQCRD
ncbi:hypothetical protein F5148DRAFT_1230902 [Russula earlei]|uniref:Uncharacterized protein n=1 Tax=Russula earlei TaxID=71964 RepID=A0ACC0TZQ4_9AGAM|nr:hypothetical protein F5148DRAFT_1230902 [Russula earlei]